MSDDMAELTENDFARMITRAQRQRLIAGTWQSGDLVALRRFLGLTQEQFAGRIGISVDTLQNWEQERRQPDGPARALLRLLARHPRLVLHDLAGVT
ncbi:MAG: helix-turn-helix domain-containing protein [Planctomycetota bacterium]